MYIYFFFVRSIDTVCICCSVQIGRIGIKYSKKWSVVIIRIRFFFNGNLFVWSLFFFFDKMLKYEQPIKTVGKNLTGIWRPVFVKVDQSLFVFGGGGHVTDELRYLDLTNMHWKVLHVSLS